MVAHSAGRTQDLTVHEIMHERASMFNNRLPALHCWKDGSRIVIQRRFSAVMENIETYTPTQFQLLPVVGIFPVDLEVSMTSSMQMQMLICCS